MLSKNEVEQSSTKGPEESQSSTKGPEESFVEIFEIVVDPPGGDGAPPGMGTLVEKSFEKIGGPIGCKESKLGET